MGLGRGCSDSKLSGRESVEFESPPLEGFFFWVPFVFHPGRRVLGLLALRICLRGELKLMCDTAIVSL